MGGVCTDDFWCQLYISRWNMLPCMLHLFLPTLIMFFMMCLRKSYFFKINQKKSCKHNQLVTHFNTIDVLKFNCQGFIFKCLIVTLSEKQMFRYNLFFQKKRITATVFLSTTAISIVVSIAMGIMGTVEVILKSNCFGSYHLITWFLSIPGECKKHKNN